MTTANEAWIQNSLARLEALEHQRAQLASGGHADQIAELDEEIRTLYEALEAVAEESDDTDDTDVSAAPAAPAGPFAEAASPFSDPSSLGVGPATAAHGAPVFSAMSSDPSDVDFDLEPKRGTSPIIIAVVAVVALVGLGGWYVSQSGTPEPAPAQPDAPKVITASEIPDDTQEPDVARGADASRTQGTRFKEGSTPQPRKSSSSSSRPRSSSTAEKTPEKIKLDSSRDPLAGVK